MIPKHLKPQRGLGKEITAQRRKQRDALRRQRENYKQESMAKAREELSRRQQVQSTPPFVKSIMASVADNQTAFMRSMGLRQFITAESGWYYNDLRAWTDFRRIFVHYPTSGMPDGSNRLDTLDTIADLRGIIQHEIGHIRFTVPFPELIEKAGVAEYVEASGKKAFHTAWNILEDQRMETLVVNAVPRIASYFTKMIYKHIVTGDMDHAWLLLAGRTYLPDDLRIKAHQHFDLNHPSHGVTPFSKRWYDIVKRYKQATTAGDMWDEVVQAKLFLDQVLPNEHVDCGTEHRDRQNRWSLDPEDDTETTGGSPSNACGDEDDSVEDTIGQSGGNPDGDSDEDTGDNDGNGQTHDGDGDAIDATGEDGTADKSGDTASNNNVNSDTDTPSPNVGGGVSVDKQREQLENSIRDQIQEQNDKITLDHRADVENQQMMASANTRSHGMGLPELSNSGFHMTDEQLDNAHKITVGIQTALTELETASQPAWHSRQDAGVLDALAYRTKQVGSLDYHRRLDGDANAGIDLHVSVLADVSGSMTGPPIRDLSVSMYAMRMACDNLGIGTSFTLWSGPRDAGRIWRHSEPVPIVWDANGGTDPTYALDDLENHNEEDASHHLVIIFTDGLWGRDFDLTRWGTDNRYIMLCVLGMDSEWMRYRADATFTIESCLELPNKLVDGIKQLNIK